MCRVLSRNNRNYVLIYTLGSVAHALILIPQYLIVQETVSSRNSVPISSMNYVFQPYGASLGTGLRILSSLLGLPTNVWIDNNPDFEIGHFWGLEMEICWCKYCLHSVSWLLTGNRILILSTMDFVASECEPKRFVGVADALCFQPGSC